MSLIERLWAGDDGMAAAVRVALAPAAAMYGAVVAARNARFDRGTGVLPVACPAISVGNLTVGGTGKTPVAAWCARALQAAGARPAIVLRGYGDDEWRVHALLTPGVVVVRDADRVRGIATAAAAGADCVVLDDAFQHRRAARVTDLVLLSADAWTSHVRLLPAGPYREPLRALRRASLVVITVKAASRTAVDAVRRAVHAVVGDRVPIAVVGLEATALQRVAPDLVGAVPATGAATPAPTPNASRASSGAPMSGAPTPGAPTPGAPTPGAPLSGAPPSPPPTTPALPLAALAGRGVLAVSAIGDPAAFERALAAAGARVTARRFRDHHAFTSAEASALARDVPSGGVAVCTLKDAVKLAPLWPHASHPLWYLSQTIVVRDGAEALADAVHRVLAARAATSHATRPIAG